MKLQVGDGIVEATSEATPATRLWRTMIHVIYRHRNEVWVRVPAWDSNLAIRVTKQNFTAETWTALLDGKGYFYGQCALGADTYQTLNITINEISDRPSPTAKATKKKTKYYAIIGSLTKFVLGVCTDAGTNDLKNEDAGSTLIRIPKTTFDRYASGNNAQATEEIDNIRKKLDK